MQKVIDFGGLEILCEANGATPRVYRRLFGEDLLIVLHDAVSKTGEVKNMEVFENLSFCMAKQAGSVPNDMTIEEWLESLPSSMGVIDAIGDIMALWRGNTNTQSIPKKK